VDNKETLLAIETSRNILMRDYFADTRPWVVAFSGGKDSTLMLQLVYEMLLTLKNKASKPVFVVSSDTCVEPPNIAAYLGDVLKLIQKQAESDSLPLKVEIVRPLPSESFWGNLIGKGYPSPTMVSLVYISYENSSNTPFHKGSSKNLWKCCHSSGKQTYRKFSAKKAYGQARA